MTVKSVQASGSEVFGVEISSCLIARGWTGAPVEYVHDRVRCDVHFRKAVDACSSGGLFYCPTTAPIATLAFFSCLSTYYLSMTGINARMLDRELKRGSAELLILSVLDTRRRHGYELGKLIHARSGGRLTFHIDSLYPLLYRLEERGWIKGAWVEKSGERRRRLYSVTARGRRVLAQQKKTWAAFVEAVRRVTRGDHA
jgi:PadR family transcriptional regulator, regulatory protein PadR